MELETSVIFFNTEFWSFYLSRKGTVCLWGAFTNWYNFTDSSGVFAKNLPIYFFVNVMGTPQLQVTGHILLQQSVCFSEVENTKTLPVHENDFDGHVLLIRCKSFYFNLSWLLWRFMTIFVDLLLCILNIINIVVPPNLLMTCSGVNKKTNVGS